ncbi:MAG: hypothetical protein KA755_01560 [Candidatus Microthrix sp.]|nr:hypothetical protein [Candidatus Microthrix sp.]
MGSIWESRRDALDAGEVLHIRDFAVCEHHNRRLHDDLVRMYRNSLDILRDRIRQAEEDLVAVQSEPELVEIVAAPSPFGRPKIKWRWPYAHLVERVWLYDDGTSFASWTCGGGTQEAQFLDDLPGEFAVCPRCITADEINSPGWRTEPDAQRLHSARALNLAPETRAHPLRTLVNGSSR